MPSHPAHRFRSPFPRRLLIGSSLLAALALPTSAQGPLQFDELPRCTLPFDNFVANAVAIADIDGDGDQDLVLGNQGTFPLGGAPNQLYENRGDGTFLDVSATRLPAVLAPTVDMGFGDVDGDGDLDLIVANIGQRNRLYLNDGAGTFRDVTMTHLPSHTDTTTSVDLGDVDGDGDLDVVFGNEWPSLQNRLYLNSGAGVFVDATTQLPVVSDGTRDLALADTDGDGDLDLICGNFIYAGGPNSFNRLYENDGNGNFSDVSGLRLPANRDDTVAVSIADFDGDGDLDIVFGGAGQDRLYLNDGTGTFADVTSSRMPAVSDVTLALAGADFDGDGDIDLFAASAFQDRLYLNSGGGVFLDVTGSRLPLDGLETMAIGVGDLDGDGDQDIVAGKRGGCSPLNGCPASQDLVYFNLQRQLHAPTAPRRGRSYTVNAYLRHGPSSTVDLAAAYLSTGSASMALPPFGTLGIDLAAAVSSPTLVVPPSSGVATASFPIPNVTGLIGQEIHAQAVLVAVPSDLRLSNVVRDVIR